MPRRGGGRLIHEATSVHSPHPPPSQIRLQLSGRHTSSTEDGYGIARVEVFAPAPPAAAASARPSSSAETLSRLQQWLSAAATMALHIERQGGGGAASAAVAEAFDVAVRALAGLARASGSLSAVLLLATALLKAPPQRQLSDGTAAALASLMHAVRVQVRLLCCSVVTLTGEPGR